MRTHNAALLILIAPIVFAATVYGATVVTPAKLGSQPSAATIPSTAPKVSPGSQYTLPCPPTAVAVLPQGGSGGSGVRSPLGQVTATATMGPNYTGPTPNITAVANALGLRTKSLTTLVAVRAGLGLSKPVGITIDYSSPAAQSRTAQSYDSCNGNRFLYNDPISGPANSPGYSVWGKPRQMGIKVTLTEDKSGGQPYMYTIPLSVNLDPLFDVSITPLRFKLNNDCDFAGDSEIRFSYRRPDGQTGKKSFSTSKGKTTTITEFAWSAQEVSTTAKVFWPDWAFYEHDPVETGAFLDGFGPQTLRLLPAAGGYVGRTIKSWHGQSCYADTAFDISVNLRVYQTL